MDNPSQRIDAEDNDYDQKPINVTSKNAASNRYGNNKNYLQKAAPSVTPKSQRHRKFVARSELGKYRDSNSTKATQQKSQTFQTLKA